MKTYRDFILEVISSTQRIRDLQTKLNKLPRNGKHKHKISILKKEINKLQRRKQLSQIRKNISSYKTSTTIRKLSPTPAKKATSRAVNFAKYTGAGMALHTFGL